MDDKVLANITSLCNFKAYQRQMYDLPLWSTRLVLCSCGKMRYDRIERDTAPTLRTEDRDVSQSIPLPSLPQLLESCSMPLDDDFWSSSSAKQIKALGHVERVRVDSCTQTVVPRTYI